MFYDGDNVAYYIAQMLELLHIKHEIYAKSLAAHLKSEYVVRFDQEAQDRVLLMDVRNAAFGLNLPSASRIYFVNPVCRPNVEAQAIKRAHRIGQTRPVFVETLVLRDSIEERMLERSKRMTRSEHRDAMHLEDDGGIREIIQSARIIPVSECENSGYGQMAPLEEPQQLWGRPGWKAFSGATVTNPGSIAKKRKMIADSSDCEDETLIDGSTRCDQKMRKTLDFVDCTGHDPDESDDEPIFNRWRKSSSGVGPTPTPKVFSMATSQDPFMPSMAHPLREDDHLMRFTQQHTCSQTQSSGTLERVYRRLSISQDLNEEQPLNYQTEPADPDLLQEILRRL